MNIVFLDADTMGSDVSLAPIAALGTFMPYAHTKPEEVVMRALEAQVIITNKVVLDEQILAQLPALKLICVAATGTNNIDLEYAKRHGILVNNAIDYSTKSVAQHTFTMLFALISNIMWYDPYVKGGAYAQSPHFTNLDRPYFEISGKRWGIIGMGNIGRCVAGIATAFGCKVNYASVSGAVRQEAYEAVALERLLLESDIISIHSPLNDKTRNLINAERIALLKPNAVLVNVGRGGIVHEEALANALNADQILGACIDVFDREPVKADNPLLKVDKTHKLVMTPHIAWASREAREKLLSIIVGHISKFKSDRT